MWMEFVTSLYSYTLGASLLQTWACVSTFCLAAFIVDAVGRCCTQDPWPAPTPTLTEPDDLANKLLETRLQLAAAISDSFDVPRYIPTDPTDIYFPRAAAALFVVPHGMPYEDIFGMKTYVYRFPVMATSLWRRPTVYEFERHSRFASATCAVSVCSRTMLLTKCDVETRPGGRSAVIVPGFMPKHTDRRGIVDVELRIKYTD